MICVAMIDQYGRDGKRAAVGIKCTRTATEVVDVGTLNKVVANQNYHAVFSFRVCKHCRNLIETGRGDRVTFMLADALQMQSGGEFHGRVLQQVLANYNQPASQRDSKVRAVRIIQGVQVTQDGADRIEQAEDLRRR